MRLLDTLAMAGLPGPPLPGGNPPMPPPDPDAPVPVEEPPEPIPTPRPRDEPPPQKVWSAVPCPARLCEPSGFG